MFDEPVETSSEDTSSFPIVPIVPPTELPPGQVSGDGMEQIQTYFTEVRAHQQNMQLVANNLSVISMVGILLVGAVIGLAIMKLVRL